MSQGRARFRFRGLRVQIVLWMVLPITLVLIGVAFTGVYSHERAMRSLVEQRDQALAMIAAGGVHDLFDRRAAALQALAAGQAFHHRVPSEQRALLAEAGDLDGLFAGDVVLLDGTGNLLLSGNGQPAWLSSGDAVAVLAAETVARQDVTLVSLPVPASGDLTLLMGVPVHDATEAVYGVLAAAVRPSDWGLGALLGQTPVGQHGVVYLVDGAAAVLAHSPSEAAQASLAGYSGLALVLRASGPGATQTRTPDGERIALAYAPLDYANLDWHVVIEQPWHEVIGPVLRFSQFMPLVAALAAIVALLTLYYGVRSIVRPLQDLGRRAERVAWGDFGATAAPVGGVEEIEELRRTLDQMAQRIQSYQRGMHDYIAAITRGQEDERRRLARELHDDTAQGLIALNQQVEMAQKLLSTDPGAAAQRLDQLRGLLATTLEGVRRFSRDLRPIYLEDLGFLPALEALAGEVDRREPFSVEFSVGGAVRRLPADLELAAYRIVQEALNNVVQHAQPAHAWVDVQFAPDSLLLSIRDDGQGFVPPDLPDALARQGHFGLMGIQERALLFGGQVTIHSSPGQGTEIAVRLKIPTDPSSSPYTSRTPAQ